MTTRPDRATDRASDGACARATNAAPTGGTAAPPSLAHPFARPGAFSLAAGSEDPQPPDRISLRDHVVEADIGAFQLERGRRQRLRFDLVVELRQTAPHGDDVDRILSYDRLTEAVAWALAAERLNLLETLAERVAARLLAEPRALRVFVRVEKLDRGPGALGVEIIRQAAPLPDAPPSDAVAADEGDGCGPQAPVVVYLSNAALAAPGLAARLDALAGAEGAVVLALGPHDLPRPVTGVPETQRRIDLLAIEQNAWALAARDPRCLVVATRTEIDWALRQGRMIVWAPSKLVLDAVEGPGGAVGDGTGLALWLAGEIGAARLEVHGAPPPPADGRLPVLSVPL